MAEKVDLLNRDDFVTYVEKLIWQVSENKKGCCFAIEGSWGIGKTFVIEKLEERLKREQLEKTKSDCYFVFHYNCWRYDYYEEPSIAIISAMLASMEKELSFFSEKVDADIKNAYGMVIDQLKKVVGKSFEKKIGIDFFALLEKIQNNSQNEREKKFAFDEMYKFGKAIDEVRQVMEKIAETRTIVLIVDELDRCIPGYAIKVLERLHHIFYGLQSVVVILAVDRKQLEHSVEKMFGMRTEGASMDTEKYLKKFIDFSIMLDEGTINKSFVEKYNFYIKKFNLQEDLNDKRKLEYMLPKLFEGIDIRSQEKIIEKANTIHSIVCNEITDISIMVFEIMYEILKFWKFGDMGIVAKINNAQYIELEKQVGKSRIAFLGEIEKKAYNSSNIDNGIYGNNKKLLLFGLYGKVFWYFAKIFNTQDMPYCLGEHEGELDELEKIARKYCELCEIIK